MSIIKLPPHLTNMIAAGEVVDRPLSVVKELVENSIDAESTSIKVSLIESGITKITVIDNGCGIAKEEMLLAFERHATSKIRSAEDLFKIASLGFRGEALPSIAAVSMVTMTSSVDGKEGYFYTLKAGEVVNQGSTQMTKGTKVEVEKLFFNTPARYKHLGSVYQELSLITDYLYKCALSHPHILFSLANNDKVLFSTSGKNDIMEIMGEAFGLDTANNVFAFEGKNALYRIYGYTSNNQVFRSHKNNISVILNGRVIKNSSLIYAVCDSYQSLIPVGKYPITVLYIESDLSLVDVNIHPSKLEVRLTDEAALKTLITTTIRNLLYSRPVFESKNERVIQEQLFEGEAEKLIEKDEENETVTESSNVLESDEDKYHFSDFWDAYPEVKPTMVQPTMVEPSMIVKEEASLIYDAPTSKEPEVKYEQPEIIKTTFFSGLDYLGQFNQTYLLMQRGTDLYLIDQHAAMERVMYEKISKSFAHSSNDCYDLLIPFKLEFSVSEALLINQKMEEIKQLGIVIDEFGSNAFIVRSVPIWIPRGLETEFVSDIIIHVINNRETGKAKMYDSLAKSLSCKESIKANMHIDRLEVKKLMNDLDQCQMPYTCPHGRPTLVKFTLYEIEKMFKRVI